jgi:hypothetical protein
VELLSASALEKSSPEIALASLRLTTPSLSVSAESKLAFAWAPVGVCTFDGVCVGGPPAPLVGGALAPDVD